MNNEAAQRLYASAVTAGDTLLAEACSQVLRGRASALAKQLVALTLLMREAERKAAA